MRISFVLGILFIVAYGLSAQSQCENLFSQSIGRLGERVDERALYIRSQVASHSFEGTAEETLKSRDAYVAALLESYPGIVTNHDLEIHADEASRYEFLRIMYQTGIVEASELSLLLSDKLLMAKAISRYMSSHINSSFFPRTVGLYELARNLHWIDEHGVLQVDFFRVSSELRRIFPTGAIAKRSAGWSSKGRDFYLSTEEIAIAIFSGEILTAEKFLHPEPNPYLGIVLSGEEWIIQGDLGRTEAVVHRSGAHGLQEFRVHTLWGNVINGATRKRWRKQEFELTDAEVKGVDQFVESFLNQLPENFVFKQAWSIDVVKVRNGQYRIVEINTNRGLESHWSGALHSPKVLQAYVRWLENNWGWSFRGWNGVLFRMGYANRDRYRDYLRGQLEYNLAADGESD